MSAAKPEIERSNSRGKVSLSADDIQNLNAIAETPDAKPAAATGTAATGTGKTKDAKAGAKSGKPGKGKDDKAGNAEKIATEGFGENLEAGKRRPVRVNPFMPTITEETYDEYVDHLGTDIALPSCRDVGRGTTPEGN